MLTGLLFLLSPHKGYAETVSILMQTGGPESTIVEAAMKHQLREEGYTVKTDTNEGVVLLLSVMQPMTRQGMTHGYIGHVSVVSMHWQNLADVLVSDTCKENHSAVQQMKDMLGARMIWIDNAMASASTPDHLANILVTSANPSIRKTFRTIQKFFDSIEEGNRQRQQADIINPMR
jgi:hypothetical protein